MSKKENISSLSVEDLLALVNYPQEEIANEVINLIKEQFSNVTDRWLINGLLDYFFSTNSKRILDLMMGAPDPHCKYLLEKISGGIRSGGDRFRHISLLLYAVSRNPPPMWFHKIPNAVMKDLLEALCPSRESDINVLVSGVMVLVLLLPALPLELTKYLSKIFECFWRLVHWTPTREHDVALKPYLQVAVYSLFHRLYALYPCNLLSYMRVNMVGQANKSWFLNTLRPMLERVRLHPLLVSETKETELSKSRWVGLEPCDLIRECAKLCLDPLQEICEEMYFSSSKRQSNCDGVPEPSEYIILCSSENNFWSPGAVQSPSTINTSVPHTPVYPFQLLGNQSTGIVEPPPEAAVEATPETTPFTSPSPFDAPHKHNSRMGSQRLPKLMTSLSEPGQETRPPLSPVSPGRKEIHSLRFPSKHGQDILIMSEKSDLLHNKLQEIQRQRVVRQREGEGSSTTTITSITSTTITSTHALENWKTTSDGICGFSLTQDEEGYRKASDECKTTQMEDTEPKMKKKVRRYGMCEFQGEIDTLFLGKELEENDKTQSEVPTINSEGDNSEITELARKNSEDSEQGNEEGLGVPCRQSMTELMKNVKTNRLRFLSQCGPPPNISLLSDFGTKKRCASPAKAKNIFSPKTKNKSRSYPNLLKDSLYVLPSSMPKREFTISSLSLSPVKPPVETFEVATQTEEAPIIDPYEQLLVALMHNRTREEKENEEIEKPSPYQILDDFIEYGCTHDPPPCQETSWNLSNQSLSDMARGHLRAMHCLMMLERYKREVHAERNRRLLGKIKRLHLLQEKDHGLQKEKAAMKKEMMEMEQTLCKLQEKNKVLEKKLGEMVEKKTLFDVQEKQSKASCQREHLRKKCDSLHEEKLALIKKMENCQSEVRECQRQLKIHLRHSSENTTLRNQVEDLNKRIVIMGEIQLEMQEQLNKYKDSECEAKCSILASENAMFSQKMEELEHRYKEKKLSLDAAYFRIGELERKVKSQQKEKLKHRQEVESTVASWKELCDVLEKRNETLYKINATLESQMTQMKYRPEKENEEGAGARRGVLPTNKDVFSMQASSSTTCVEAEPLSEIASESYLARMTSRDFKSIGSPNPDEL